MNGTGIPPRLLQYPPNDLLILIPNSLFRSSINQMVTFRSNRILTLNRTLTLTTISRELNYNWIENCSSPLSSLHIQIWIENWQFLPILSIKLAVPPILSTYSNWQFPLSSLHIQTGRFPLSSLHIQTGRFPLSSLHIQIFSFSPALSACTTAGPVRSLPNPAVPSPTIGILWPFRNSTLHSHGNNSYRQFRLNWNEENIFRRTEDSNYERCFRRLQVENVLDLLHYAHTERNRVLFSWNFSYSLIYLSCNAQI